MAAAYQYLSLSVVFTPRLLTRVLELCSVQSPAAHTIEHITAATERQCHTPLGVAEKAHSELCQRGDTGTPNHHHYLYLKTLFNHNLSQRCVRIQPRFLRQVLSRPHE